MAVKATNLNPGQIVVREFDKVKGEVKNINSLCKITSSANTVINTASMVCKPLASAAAVAGGFSTVAGLFNTVGHIKDFTCPDEKTGVYNWQFWKKGAKWSPEGTASNILLTGSDALDPILFASKIGLFSLGAAATPLAIAKSTMLLGASVLGIVDNSRKLYKNDKTLAEQVARKKKWEERKVAIEEYNAKKELGTVDPLFKEKKEKFDKLFEKQSNYSLVGISDPKAIARMEYKIKKWDLLLPKEDAQGKIDLKCMNKRVEQWNDRVKVAKENHYIKRTHDALSLTVNICQLALGIIGLVGVVLTLCSVGVAATPAFIIACAAGWLVTHILSLTKSLYNDYNKAQPLPDMKDLTALYAAAA